MTTRRIRYFDLLRVIAFGLIIWYHMIVQLNLSGLYEVEEVAVLYENANIHVATLAVAVFFMLSGAGLMYASGDSFRIGTFYKKRFLKLMIPFYLVYVLCVLLRFVLDGAVNQAFPSDVAPWKIVFSVLGVDGLLKNYGISTFYNVGEWFLGAVLLFYLLFPLLRYLMLKQPAVFFAAATALYIAVAATYSAELPIHLSLRMKGYEFVVGMLFGLIMKKNDRRFPRPVFLAAAALTAVFFFSPVTLPIPEGFRITLSAGAFFIVCSGVERLLSKRPLQVLDVMSAHTYEAFLVHHVVIFFVTPRVLLLMEGEAAAVVCVLVQLVLIAAGAAGVKLAVSRIMRAGGRTAKKAE